MERPERYKDYPEQFRWTSQSWISESSIRNVTEQLESIDLDNPDPIIKCLLEHLYLSYQWGTFHDFIDDFDNTKLGKFFAAKNKEETDTYHIVELIDDAWLSINHREWEAYEKTLEELKKILGHVDPTFLTMEWEAADTKAYPVTDEEF